jgi:hypothetical protein
VPGHHHLRFGLPHCLRLLRRGRLGLRRGPTGRERNGQGRHLGQRCASRRREVGGTMTAPSVPRSVPSNWLICRDFPQGHHRPLFGHRRHRCWLSSQGSVGLRRGPSGGGNPWPGPTPPPACYSRPREQGHRHGTVRCPFGARKSACLQGFPAMAPSTGRLGSVTSSDRYDVGQVAREGSPRPVLRLLPPGTASWCA